MSEEMYKFTGENTAICDKHESYEKVMDQRKSVTYLVTEEAILKYHQELYKEFPSVKEAIDSLNDDSKLRSDNSYVTKRVS